MRTSERVGYWGNGDWYLKPYEPEKYYFDTEIADRWEAFFPEFCRHLKGELQGQPFELMDWLRQYTRELMGWRVRADDTRRYMTGAVWVPKKNSKTLWVACLALGMLLIDGEKGAEAYIAASNEEQARIGFEMASNQLAPLPDGSPAPLAEYLHASADRITLLDDPNTYFQVLSGTAEGKTGPNVHLAVIDEVHEHKSAALIKHLKQGMISRKNGLLLYTSTAGERLDGPGYREYVKSVKVLEGKARNDRYLPVIYEAPPGSDWTDRRVWQIANPGYGKSVNPVRMEQEFLEIEDKDDENRFKVFYLNLWGSTAEDFISTAEWDACYEAYSLDDLYARSWPYVFGGMDLGASDDMTASSLLFVERQADDIIYRVHVDYFVPDAILSDKQKKGFRYQDWASAGLLITTDGDITDYRRVRERAKEHRKRLGEKAYKTIVMDRNMANETSTNLQEEDGFEVIHLPQTFSYLTGATKRLKELVKTKHIRHNGHEVLNWNVQNAMAIKDNSERVMLSKKKSKGKIDGLASIVFALTRAIVAPPPPKPSIYSQRGLL